MAVCVQSDPTVWSRETVTRLFADLKKKQLLRIKGSTLIVCDKARLEILAGA